MQQMKKIRLIDSGPCIRTHAQGASDNPPGGKNRGHHIPPKVTYQPRGANWVYFLVDMLERKSTELGMFLRKKHEIREFGIRGCFSGHYKWPWLTGVVFVGNIRPTLTCYKIPGIIQKLVILYKTYKPPIGTNLTFAIKFVININKNNKQEFGSCFERKISELGCLFSRLKISEMGKKFKTIFQHV